MANNKRVLTIVNLLIFLLNILLIVYNVRSDFFVKFPFNEHCGTPQGGVALINGKLYKTDMYRDTQTEKLKCREIVLRKEDLKQKKLEIIVPNYMWYKWDLPETGWNILFLGLSNHYLPRVINCEGGTTNKLSKYVFEVNDRGYIILRNWHLKTSAEDLELDIVIRIEIT